jgi:uncharacterized damage-inducible protein DinB
MNWTEVLKSEVEEKFAATEGLLELVDDSELGWKPESGSNWMTLGQLVEHLTNACGMMFHGFATGDWGVPAEEMENMKPEDMMPPAEKMPTAESLAEVRRKMAEDKQLALKTLDDAGEERLATQETPAPWDPRPLPLGYRLLGMVEHLGNHRAQLFYYLKLMGKPVNTMHLYGMSVPAE